MQLEHSSRLQQIQLLSHEYKIAGKIELQVASSLTLPDKTPYEFTRLGFLSFDTNDRTNFAARELKSVTLPDVEATVVKLIIHRCHANTMNTHSQACLIMLNLVGEPLHQVSSSSTTTTTLAASLPVVLSAPPAPLTNPINNNNNTNSTSSGQEIVDEITAQRIYELQEKKAAAVAIEDYDEAKSLKAAIEKLRAVGVKMAALEAKKKAAVDAEDYDMAKALKIELERMRHRAYVASTHGGDHYRHDDLHFDSTEGTSNGDITSNKDRMMLSPGRQHQQAATTPLSPAYSSMDSYGSKSDKPSPEIFSSTFMQNSTQQKHRPTTSGAASSDWRSYDERPARAAGVYDITNFEDLNADSAPPGAVITSSNRGENAPLRPIDENADHHGSNPGQQTTTAAAAQHMPCPPAPAGFPSELPLPEPLSQDDAKESGPIEVVIGEFLTRCLYSKSWQLREAGITAIATAVCTSSPDALPRLDGDGDALHLLCGVVAQGLEARIPAVAAAALVLLRSLVQSAAARQLPSRDLHAALTGLLPVVAERACDPKTTARTRGQAVEALLDIARVKESGIKSLTGIFLKPYKTSEFPKITQRKLHLVDALLLILGVVPNNSLDGSGTSSSPDGSIGGFSAEAVIQFCCPALKSANAEVRSAAAELVVKVGRAPGVGAHVVLQLLPPDVNPKLKQRLEEDLTGGKRIIRGARPVSGNNKNTSGASNAGASAAITKSKSAATSAASLTRMNNVTSAAGSTAATASENKAAEARSQASSRHHSSTSANAASAAAKNTRPPLNSPPSQQQEQQWQGEYEYNNQEKPRPSQQTSSRAGATTSMPPSSSQPQAPPQQQEKYKQIQQQVYPQEDASTLYTPSIVGAEFSVADEDPAPFEEELRRREATLGPSHPHVAEAASNLAIIYNQRGDGDRALPLYQRALTIWEMTHGPHHPDVAHALTDIAVILLEAGHDVQGKQLLRRALGIQMELLGPMHPDVIAIKDVLDEN